MCSEVIRNKEVIKFNINRVVEAIVKALESIRVVVEEATETITNALGTLAHSIAHCLMHAYHWATGRIRKRLARYNPFCLLRLAALVCTMIKLLTVSYLEHAHVYRVERLIRTQDRGTDGNSDDDLLAVYSLAS